MSILGHKEIDQKAWDTFAHRTNYVRIEAAIDKLARQRRFYEFRAHLPMYEKSVCVGYTEGNVGVSWQQTAHMTVALDTERATIGIDDIRRERDGKELQTGLIRFSDKLPYRAGGRIMLDGFIAEVYPDGHNELAGLIGHDQVPIPGIVEADADSFVIACLLAIENRSRT